MSKWALPTLFKRGNKKMNAEILELLAKDGDNVSFKVLAMPSKDEITISLAKGNKLNATSITVANPFPKVIKHISASVVLSKDGTGVVAYTDPTPTPRTAEQRTTSGCNTVRNAR